MNLELFWRLMADKSSLLTRVASALGVVLLATVLTAGPVLAQTTTTQTAVGAGYVQNNIVTSNDGANSNFVVGRTTPLAPVVSRGYLTFDVPASATAYSTAVLRLDVSDIVGGPNDVAVYDVTNLGAAGSDVFTDLGSGTVFGTATGLNTSDATILITLNPAGLAAVNAARGGSISFGFVNTTTSDTVSPAEDYVFGNSAFSAPRELVLTTPAPVPTLSEWAMILFGLLLAGGAALFIQRRQSLA